jgi:hypothetical protein
LLDHLKREAPQVGTEISTSKDLGPETEAVLRAAIKDFKASWSVDVGIA